MVKNKKKEVYYTGDGILVIDGKEYVESITREKDIDGIKHTDKTLMALFNRKDFEDKCKFIANSISKKLDKKLLIKELVKKRGINEVNSLYKILYDKKKRKKISVQRGCLGVKIGSGKKKTGGGYIQLID